MMKYNKPRISIKTKIWISIISIVVCVIATIWFLQTFYLEGYYLKKKQNEFSSVVSSVVNVIDEQGFEASQDKLIQIASNNILCIDISDNYGQRLVTYEGLNYNCYIHQNARNRLNFLRQAVANEGKQIITTVNEGKNSEYLLLAVNRICR